MAVVNALGDVLDGQGKVLAGARNKEGKFLAEVYDMEDIAWMQAGGAPLQNTTLVCIATNVSLSKVEVNRMAQRAHDGMARAIKPAHTSFDGDIIFGLASGASRAPIDVVAEAGAEVTAQAIRAAVVQAS